MTLVHLVALFLCIIKTDFIKYESGCFIYRIMVTNLKQVIRWKKIHHQDTFNNYKSVPQQPITYHWCRWGNIGNGVKLEKNVLFAYGQHKWYWFLSSILLCALICKMRPVLHLKKATFWEIICIKYVRCITKLFNRSGTVH